MNRKLLLLMTLVLAFCFVSCSHAVVSSPDTTISPESEPVGTQEDTLDGFSECVDYTYFENYAEYEACVKAGELPDFVIPWEYLEHLGTFHHFWYGNGNFCYTVVDERGFTYRLQFEFPPENMETKEYIFNSDADSLRTINTGHDRVLYRTIGNAEYVYNFGKLYLIYLNVGAYQVHIASGFDAYPETGPETVMSRLLELDSAESEVKALSEACAKK